MKRRKAASRPRSYTRMDTDFDHEKHKRNKIFAAKRRKKRKHF